MILPVQVRFRHMRAYDPAEKWVLEAVRKMDEFYPKIMSCRVVLEKPHRSRRSGNPYEVHVDLSVPGKELVVMHEADLHSTQQRLRRRDKPKRRETKDRHQDLHVAIHDAFETAGRQLRDYARKQRRELKTHAAPPHARVSRLFPEEGYGFLTTHEGREIYFHRASVLRNGFKRMEVGTEVNYVEEKGEKGPQASTVKLTRTHRSPYREKKARHRTRPIR